MKGKGEGLKGGTCKGKEEMEMLVYSSAHPFSSYSS